MTIAENNPLVTSFLAWEQASLDTIDFKKVYVDMTGDLVAGLTLSQIVYWHLPGRNGVTKLSVSHDGYLWVAKKRSEWWDEIRISPKQLDRALKILTGKNLVVVKLYHYDGKPTVHVRLNWDHFVEEFQRSIFPKGENRHVSILPKGKNAISPKGKIAIIRNTENTTENTEILFPADAGSPEIPPLEDQELPTPPVARAPSPRKKRETATAYSSTLVFDAIAEAFWGIKPDAEDRSDLEGGRIGAIRKWLVNRALKATPGSDLSEEQIRRLVAHILCMKKWFLKQNPGCDLKSSTKFREYWVSYVKSPEAKRLEKDMANPTPAKSCPKCGGAGYILSVVSGRKVAVVCECQQETL